MSLVQLPVGLMWPYAPVGALFPLNNGSATMDATGEKVAHIGRLHLAGGSGSKTLSTGTIQFRCNTSTFANAGTSLDVGIQDVSGSGPIAQPDGAYGVKRTLTGGSGITSLAWNTVTMNSGSKTMSHGDLIAVVWDMTARAGADSVVVNAQGASSNRAVTNVYLAGAWGTTVANGGGGIPSVVIVFDDGTLGWLDSAQPYSNIATESFQDSTNPDERGMLFQVPFDCEIDAFFAQMTNSGSAVADLTFKLYSDPTGSPALITSSAILAEQIGVATAPLVEELSAKVALTKNTDYGLTILGTGTANLTLNGVTLGDTAHRAAYNGGTTLKKITRNNSSGAFTAENPAVTLYCLGVRIAAVNDTAGFPASRAKLGM